MTVDKQSRNNAVIVNKSILLINRKGENHHDLAEKMKAKCRDVFADEFDLTILIISDHHRMFHRDPSI